MIKVDISFSHAYSEKVKYLVILKRHGSNPHK